MGKKRKTQWHPAFCSAVRLELRADKQKLQYANEYNLNTKPVQIDLLVIKKPAGAVLENEIGKVFMSHNVMEYKSPEDSMDVDTYYKALAYVYLYKAGGERVDEIRADDISLSLVRERKPRELMRYLKDNGYIISHPYPGIYYVQKDGFPKTQIIVSRELDRESHRWLTALTSNMDQVEAKKLVYDIQTLTEKDDREYADSVFEVSRKENRELFETIKKKEEIESMKALLEYMKPEVDQIVKKEREKERKNTERERRRAVAAEEEILRLREELRRLKEK